MRKVSRQSVRPSGWLKYTNSDQCSHHVLDWRTPSADSDEVATEEVLYVYNAPSRAIWGGSDKSGAVILHAPAQQTTQTYGLSACLVWM